MQANKTTSRHLTKSEHQLAAAEQVFSDDPERQGAIAAARRFKASWFELGETLLTVRKNDRWKKWGHGSFEDYCRKELHLKPETVEKLTGSYAFLQKRAPEVLRRDARTAPLPSYQAVDFWRKAEEETTGAPPELLAELQTRVLDEGADLPSLSRVYKPVLFPLDDEAQQAEKRRLLSAAVKRLRALIEDEKIVAKRYIEALAEPLEKLANHLEKNSDN